MTKVTEDNKSHSASGQYTDTPDNTASLQDKEENKPKTRQGDHHKQKEDRILELEDQIEELKHESAKLSSEGKKDAEKEKQREMSHAHDELVKLRADVASQ